MEAAIPVSPTTDEINHICGKYLISTQLQIV
jgi:hypothetical protein